MFIDAETRSEESPRSSQSNRHKATEKKSLAASIEVTVSVGTIHRCINVSRYLSHDLFRDTVCKNRDTRDLATFLRFYLNVTQT